MPEGDKMNEIREVMMGSVAKPYKYVPKAESEKRTEHNFTYHPPKDGQADRYGEIRMRAKLLAEYLMYNCPESRELSLAMTKLEEAVFWSNAAIARNE